jgi:hypothetical protein
MVTLLFGGSTHLYSKQFPSNAPGPDQLPTSAPTATRPKPGFSVAELRGDRSSLGTILPGQNPRKATVLNAVPTPQSTPRQPLAKATVATVPAPPKAKAKPIAAKPIAAKPIAAKPAPANSTPPTIPAEAPPLPVQSAPTSLPEPVQTAYQPPYDIRWADPSNYGDRFTVDVYNRPIPFAPLIVLHETVAPADSVIANFQTPHPKEADQASYHTMIRRNGTIVYMVPPEKRAYGAGNSVFNGANGPETAKTHAKFPPSVNNFAYHISLESPADGYGKGDSHSGYSPEQYQSLAWLVAQSRVPEARVTTHRAVDRSGDRIDPRNFRREKFISLLRELRGGPS